MLMERPSKRPRILNQPTQELYIPGHQACLLAWRSLYTGKGVEKQGKTPLYGREPVMRLSTKGRYAVMAMADLAGNATNAQSPGDPRPVALADIAARQDISLSYLEQLFAKLRRGGLVTRVGGAGGGCGLS